MSGPLRVIDGGAVRERERLARLERIAACIAGLVRPLPEAERLEVVAIVEQLLRPPEAA
jgi:hypothetical protein